MGRDLHKSSMTLLVLLRFAFLASASAHGGMMWPPTWQDGFGRPIEALTNDSVFSLPVVRDPNSDRAVVNIKSWLTDQAYTGGVGDQFKGIGPVTNDNNKKLPRGDRCKGSCDDQEPLGSPWTSPQPRWRLRNLRRKPRWMPSWKGHPAPRFSVWTTQGGRWTW